MQATFRTVLGRLVAYIDAKSKEGQPIDAIKLARLYAAEVGSNVVYGSKEGLNLLGDEGQRQDFERDLKWTENRFLTLWSLLLLWYPSASALQMSGASLTEPRLHVAAEEDGTYSIRGAWWCSGRPSDESKRKKDASELTLCGGQG